MQNRPSGSSRPADASAKISKGALRDPAADRQALIATSADLMIVSIIPLVLALL
jgi:hypothetical protein